MTESGRTQKGALPGKHEGRIARRPVLKHLRRIIFPVAALLLVAGVVFQGLASRARATAALTRVTQEMAVPTLTVTHPKEGVAKEEIVLPGNVQAYTDAPIYARTSGYLRRWYFDIGSRVKTGQLLAEIDTPEIDQQLQQARADLATAEANYHLAETTAERWQNLLKTDSVSKQETEEKLSDLKVKKATQDSARFNVKRLEELQSFQKIYAPFDGVITARNTDVGALIDAGSGSPAKELFHLAATQRLRVYVNVPESYARSAVPGVRARLNLAEYPEKSFTGILVRTADAIDPGTRTLLVEVDVDNPKGELLPGAFTEVHLKLPSIGHTLIVPVNTLIFRSEGLRIATVRGGKTNLVPVVLGRDFGTEVEVLSGLSGDESVVVNPPDSLISGVEVRVAPEGAGGSQQ